MGPSGLEKPPSAGARTLLREGLTSGFVLGVSDMLATGPWRAPLLLSAIVVASCLTGGLAAGVLALPVRRPGAAAALALFGAVALQGASLVTKELEGSAPLLVFALGIALVTAAMSVVTTARSGRTMATLVALVAVPAGSLVASVGGMQVATILAGLTLPLVVLILAAGRTARAAAWIAAGLSALLPLPVLLLDPAPLDYVEHSELGAVPDGDAPDVLLIVVDTLRADAVDWITTSSRTPNLAAIAQGGVRFEQAIASASWTLPSMSSLFTGLLPSQHGAVDRLHALPEDVTTLAERFRAGGYKTAAFTGGAFVDPGYGLAQGFEHFDPRAEYWFRPLRVHVPLAWRVVKNRYLPQRWVLRRVREFGGVRALRARLLLWLEQQDQARPMFLCAHTYQVHDYYLYHPEPDDAVRASIGDPPASIGERLTVHPDEILGMGPEAIEWFEVLYRARLDLVDRELGQLLAEVRARRTERELLVVLTSDHGEGFDAASGRVHHGGRLHDDLLRIPLVLSWMPKGQSTRTTRLMPGRVVEQQVRQVDLVPTLIELAGLEPASGLAGMSLLPALSGETEFPATAWAEEHIAGPRWLALRSPPWKLIDGPAGKQRYDVSRDPREGTALELKGIPGLDRLWISFDERYPARVRSRARIDASVRHQLDHIGYGD